MNVSPGLQIEEIVLQEIIYSQEVIALTSELADELPPATKTKLDQLTGKIYSAQAIESEAFFMFGFSLGIKLQQEITEQLHPLE